MDPGSGGLHDALMRDMGVYGLAVSLGMVRDGVSTSQQPIQDCWAQPAVPQHPQDQLTLLLRRVMEDHGIHPAELRAGDVAASNCLCTAIEAHATLQHSQERLQRWQAVAESSAQQGGSSGEVTPHAATAEQRARPFEDTPSASKRKRPSTAGAEPAAAPDLVAPAATALATLAAATSKGLKHFSMKVCEKVESKGDTNYNEVADELVAEMAEEAAAGLGEGRHDEKNIRRRVYDAINVLEALGMVDKGKKDIRWRGWPAALGASPKERLEAARAKLAARLQRKARAASDASAKAFCLGNLVMRNRDAVMPALLAAQEADLAAPNPLALPFMLVAAPGDALVDVDVSADERTAHLNFHHWPISIYDDESVMRAMGLGQPWPELDPGQAAAAPDPGRFVLQQQQQQQREQAPAHADALRVLLQQPSAAAGAQQAEQEDATPVKAAAHALHSTLSILSPASALQQGQQRQQRQEAAHPGHAPPGPFPSGLPASHL